MTVGIFLYKFRFNKLVLVYKLKKQGDGEEERLSLSSAVKVIVGQRRSHGCRAVWRDSLQSTASDKWALTRTIDKSKSQSLNFKDSCFFFFFFLFIFRKAVVRQLFDAKQTDILRSPRGERREMNIGASPPSGPASLPRRHTREAWRPCPSLLPPFGAGGPSPTSEEAARRATCAALASRPCLISLWYLRGSSL